MIAEISQIQAQLQEKWQIFWVALSLGVLVFGLACLFGLFRSFKISFLPIIQGKDVLRGFGLFLFVELLLIPAIAGVIFTISRGDPDQTFFLHPQIKGWINLSIIFGGSGGVFLAYLGLTSSQRDQLWKQTNDPWYIHVGIGIVAWIVSYPLVLAFSQGLSIVLWHIFQHPSVEQVAVQNLRYTMANPLLFGLTALAIVIVVPFTEEFLFRGLLQSWIKRKFHRASVAIILSSLVFSLFHYSSHHGVTNIELLSSLFLLSCMLGYIYERQRSLWAPIGLHSFFNLMSLLMLLVNPTSSP